MTNTTVKKLEEEPARALRDDFEERGWDQPNATRADALIFAAPIMGSVTPSLKPVNKAAANLFICKKDFLKGQRDVLSDLQIGVENRGGC